MNEPGRGRYSREVLRLLRERPRTREELIQALIPYVPPGQAFRLHDWELRRQKAKHRTHKRSRRIEISDRVRAGARARIANTLLRMRERGSIVVENDLWRINE